MESCFNLEANRMKAVAWVFVLMAVLSFIALFVAVPLVERTGVSPMPIYLSVLVVSLFAIVVFWIMQNRIYFKLIATFIKTPEGLEIVIGKKTFRKFSNGYTATFCFGIEKVNSYTRKMAKRIEIKNKNRSTFISEVIDEPVKNRMSNLEVSDLVATVPGTIDELIRYLEIKT
jgi:hypothetical protein